MGGMYLGLRLQLGKDAYEAEKTKELISAFYKAKKDLTDHLSRLTVEPYVKADGSPDYGEEDW